MKIKDKIKNNKKRLLEELENSYGIITIACKICDLSRGIFYQYYNKDQKFKKRVDEISEQTIDFAENSLLKQIKSGDTTATIFYLKTKGKSRGYVEKTESKIDVTTVNIEQITGMKIIENGA